MIRKIIDALSALYPEAKAELHFSNPFETLIATILSAQCTDKRVNMVTETMFRDYPDAKSITLDLPSAGSRRTILRSASALARRSLPSSAAASPGVRRPHPPASKWRNF